MNTEKITLGLFDDVRIGSVANNYSVIERAVRDYIRGGLKGDVNIHYVDMEKLESDGALAKWEGNDIYLPKPGQVRRLLGSVFEVLKINVKNSYPYLNYNEIENKALSYVMDYILGHEIVERYHKTTLKETGFNDRFSEAIFEASYLTALEDLTKEGDEKAKGLYEAGLAIHKLRLEYRDPFALCVSKYYKLHEKIKDMMYRFKKSIKLISDTYVVYTNKA